MKYTNTPKVPGYTTDKVFIKYGKEAEPLARRVYEHICQWGRFHEDAFQSLFGLLILYGSLVFIGFGLYAEADRPPDMAFYDIAVLRIVWANLTPNWTFILFGWSVLSLVLLFFRGFVEALNRIGFVEYVLKSSLIIGGFFTVLYFCTDLLVKFGLL